MYLPYRTTSPAIPAWYQKLAEEPDDFAILDLPVDLVVANNHYMFYQTTHGKPLVEGRISRPPKKAFTFLESTPFLEKLSKRNEMDPDLYDVTHQLTTLSDAGVRYLVMHKKFASSEQLANWQDWLTFEPFYQDDELIVYRTEPIFGQDYYLTVDLTEEIGLLQTSFTPDEILQGETF